MYKDDDSLSKDTNTCSEIDEFFDADQEFHDSKGYISTDMPLEKSLREAMLASNSFFNNDFEMAKEILRPWKDSSIYHAMGFGTLTYLEAVMTFEPKDISEAVSVLSNSLHVCDQARKHCSVGKSVTRMIGKHDYNCYTDEQCHAELCYAECLLLRALISFLEDDSILCLIKGGFKIKTCLSCLNECWRIFKYRKWTNLYTKMCFEAGVKLGLGIFNLMISHFPVKILRLLEFVGFTGNRVRALTFLTDVTQMTDTPCRPLSSLVLLGYQLYARTMFSGQCHQQLVQQLLARERAYHAHSLLFHMLDARAVFVAGAFERAHDLLVALSKRQARGSTDCGPGDGRKWQQLMHLCDWELYWVHALLGHWAQAAECGERLLATSRWSRTVYSYLVAVARLMCEAQAADTACVTRREVVACGCVCVRPETTRCGTVDELMRALPAYKQKIAGKSLPFEKMAIGKADKYRRQGGRLIVPGYEVIYMWNVFDFYQHRGDLLQNIYDSIESKLRRTNLQKSDCTEEDNALLLFLSGVCLTHLNKPLLAEQSFLKVTQLHASIHADTYLVPFAWMELGLLSQKMKRPAEAKSRLQHSLNSYKKYMMENRLHFRVHSALYELTKF